MHVTAIKTRKVYANDNLEEFLVESLPATLAEESIVVIASKVVALCEGRVVPKKSQDHDAVLAEKHALARQEAEWYLPENTGEYCILMTIKHHTLAVSAGIDQSNIGDSQFVLLPKDPAQSADRIWKFLRNKYSVKKLGVIITDSRSQPLRWGIVGMSMGFAGVKQLHNLIGSKDIFGRVLEMTQVSVVESVSVAAVLEMGEGGECQPLAIVTGVSQAEFVDRSFTQAELDEQNISLEDDMYSQLLLNAPWEKGGGGIT